FGKAPALLFRLLGNASTSFLHCFLAISAGLLSRLIQTKSKYMRGQCRRFSITRDRSRNKITRRGGCKT
ncbi:unnamed protein product, partial [Amoebophrya sp. A25]